MSANNSNSPPESLSTFCNLVDADGDLQARVKASQNPQEVIDIANSLGLEISPTELRVWSRELSAAYFPWTGKGHEYRRNFFTGRL